MKIKKIRKIIKAFEQSSVEQLVISKGKMKIRLQKPPLETFLSDSKNSTVHQAEPSDSQWILSPLVGTFYLHISSEFPPLITIGKQVRKNDILCIIETMKVFNEIKSPVDGVITKITVDDGQMVEYHQPIIEVRCND